METRLYMNSLLIDKIETLPALPESIIELEDIKRLDTADTDKLIAIIEKDPFLITTVLKIANSSMFAFRSKVETLSKAINLLGINFTISIAMGALIQNKIESNLCAYAVSNEDFLSSAMLATKIVNTWVSSINYDLKEELLLPAFLQECGKFIISDLVQTKKLTEEFLQELDETNDVNYCEEKYTGFSCARITANVFKHWSLSYKLIFAIGFVGNSNNCPEEFKQKVQILEIVKILADIRNPLSDENIEKALNKASEYNLDIDHLINSIDVIKDEQKENS